MGYGVVARGLFTASIIRLLVGDNLTHEHGVSKVNYAAAPEASSSALTSTTAPT